MLTEVMSHLKNYFITNKYETGKHSLVNGELAVKNKYLKGQYVLIQGSMLNDGSYKVESFEDGIISFRPKVEEYPPWIKPTNSTNAYFIGDKVSHNNKRWVSLQDINIIEPDYPSTTGTWWDEIAGGEIQDPLTDEDFTGTIYSQRIPNDFIELVKIIQAEIQTDTTPSNVVSASFGIQSVTYATDGNGVKAGWQTTHARELSQYRRYSSDV